MTEREQAIVMLAGPGTVLALLRAYDVQRLALAQLKLELSCVQSVADVSVDTLIHWEHIVTTSLRRSAVT